MKGNSSLPWRTFVHMQDWRLAWSCWRRMNGSDVRGYTCTINHPYQVLPCSLQVIENVCPQLWSCRMGRQQQRRWWCACKSSQLPPFMRQQNSCLPCFALLCSTIELVIKHPNQTVCGLRTLLGVYVENILLSPMFVAEIKTPWLVSCGKCGQLIYFQLLYSFVLSKNTPSPTHT